VRDDSRLTVFFRAYSHFQPGLAAESPRQNRCSRCLSANRPGCVAKVIKIDFTRLRTIQTLRRSGGSVKGAVGDRLIEGFVFRAPRRIAADPMALDNCTGVVSWNSPKIGGFPFGVESDLPMEWQKNHTPRIIPPCAAGRWGWTCRFPLAGRGWFIWSLPVRLTWNR